MGQPMRGSTTAIQRRVTAPIVGNAATKVKNDGSSTWSEYAALRHVIRGSHVGRKAVWRWLFCADLRSNRTRRLHFSDVVLRATARRLPADRDCRRRGQPGARS